MCKKVCRNVCQTRVPKVDFSYDDDMSQVNLAANFPKVEGDIVDITDMRCLFSFMLASVHKYIWRQESFQGRSWLAGSSESY